MADFVSAEKFSSFPSLTGKLARDSVEGGKFFALYVAQGNKEGLKMKFSTLF